METTTRDDLLQALPLLRQYAFCLTGSRERGDALVEKALLEFLSSGSAFGAHSPVIAYFRAFHTTEALFEAGRGPVDLSGGAVGTLQQRLMGLQPMQLQALLLVKTIGFTYAEAAEILDLTVDGTEDLVLSALAMLVAGHGRSALIIEDDIFIASELGRILTGLGFEETATVSRYEDAVSAVSDKRPDLILADIKLRNSRSGVDTVRHIRGLYDDAPVVYVTAYPELAEKLPNALRGGIIRKPFESTSVVKTVEETLTRTHWGY